MEKKYPIFLQATDLDSPFIKQDNLFYVHEDEWIRYPKGRIKKGELLIEVKGKIEKVAIVPHDFPEKVLVSGSIYKMSINDKISKHYILTFLLSKYGVVFKDRYKTNLLISYLAKDDLYKIPIPLYSKDFQNLIDAVFLKIYEAEKLSKTLYAEAENILLQELGLFNWQPVIKNNNSKTFKESYLESGRIDAEYYQPKYDELLRVLNQFNHDILGKLVSTQKSIEPGSAAYQNEGIPFIRVANLSKNGISESDVFLSNDEFGNFPVMPKKNTILLSKDGSVGIAYKVEEDLKSITSGAILHLTVTSKKVLPDYLTLVINSVIVKMQAERDAGGSIIQHWKPDEIKQVIIPVVDTTIQKVITEKVQQSFTLLTKSHQLLEAAKKAVEIAIEQNEKVAINYLKNL